MKRCIGILFLIVFSALPVSARSVILLGNTTAPPLTNPEHTGMLDLIAKELFGRIGLSVKIETLPAERSLISANDGITDGELVRLAGISQMYPNLIQIPEKMGDIEIVAFTGHIKAEIRGWQSLKPYHVAFVRGWKILENNVSETASLTKVSSPEILFNLLDKNRTDIILYHRLPGYWLIENMGLKDIKALEPSLVSQEMFLYLHKKHEGIVLKLTNALKEMKQDGTYERLTNQSVGHFLPERKQ